MLNAKVPGSINDATRLVVLNHPSSMDCVVFRKRLNRVDDPAGSEGGEPTLGGMGVLDSVDEDDIDYDEIGHARILFTDGFQQGASMVDRDDAQLPPPEVMGLIEYLEQPEPNSADARKALKKHDVIYVVVSAGIHMPYEVMNFVAQAGIPGFARKVVMQARDELAFLDLDPSDPPLL